MGAWKDIMIEQDFASQQAADDWCRYEMERDEAIARRRELVTRAWQLHRVGTRLARLFPDIGSINLQIAEQFRAEAREIRRHWR